MKQGRGHEMEVAGCRLQVAGCNLISPYYAGRPSEKPGFTRFAFHASRSTHGFTLLELIIVMTLASLMMGMAALVFVNTLPSARLGSTGREMSAAIRQMGTLARNRGEDQVLTINLDTRQYGPEGGLMKALPAQISVMVSDPVIGEIRYGKYSILFHAAGGVEGGTVVLGYKKKLVYIQTDPVVGSVVIRQ
jgi:general secretion pathway protein H